MVINKNLTKVIAMQNLNLSLSETRKQNILLLDLDHAALSFQICRGQETIDFGQESEAKTHLMLKTAGHPRSVLQSILSSLAQEGELSETTIFLGCYSDPFTTSESNFDFALQIIEILLNNNPHKLIIKTSSPLIFLAVPLLINSKDKVQFHTKVEYTEKLNKIWCS